MNKTYGFFLIIFALLLIFGSVNIPIYDKNIFVPYWVVYPVALVTLLFAIWKIIEIRDEKSHKMVVKFRSYIRRYLENRGGYKSDNLLLVFPGKINSNKDLYYIDNNLVMMISNQTINGEFKPGGYYLKMTKFNLGWLYVVTSLKIIFDYKYFNDFFLLGTSVLLITYLFYKEIVELIFKIKKYF